MIRSLLLGTICFLLAASSCFSAPFNDANQQFRTGDFAGAAAAYEKILANDGPCAAVLYNLGNSYQSLKQYGPAILAYERARLLTPRDPDLLANLALARKAATAFEQPGKSPRLQAALEYLSSNEWSWLVAGSALFLGITSVIRGAVSLPLRFRKLRIVAVCVASFAIAIGSVALYLRRGETLRGIVLSEEATVRLSPFEKAESLGTAGPGRVVLLGPENGGFRYVEIPGTSLRGWLAAHEVAAINPAPADK
jgi:tetratricopeptide (TPR) repeat protein